MMKGEEELNLLSHVKIYNNNNFLSNLFEHSHASSSGQLFPLNFRPLFMIFFFDS